MRNLTAGLISGLGLALIWRMFRPRIAGGRITIAEEPDYIGSVNGIPYPQPPCNGMMNCKAHYGMRHFKNAEGVDVVADLR